MSVCRDFLKAAYATAPPAAIKKFAKAAVLGGPGLGFTIELQDGRQIDVGKQHCRYCARAEGLIRVESAR